MCLLGKHVYKSQIKAGRENLYINPPLLTLLSERA